MKLQDAWRGLRRCGWKKAWSANTKRQNWSWWVPKRVGAVIGFDRLPHYLGTTSLHDQNLTFREEFDLLFDPRSRFLCMTFFRGRS